MILLKIDEWEKRLLSYREGNPSILHKAYWDTKYSITLRLDVFAKKWQCAV